MKKLLTGFDPVIAPHPRAMILGSMPSVVSLEKQEYYGFRHNRFWKIMGEYFKEELNTYEDKKHCIKDHHLILWDVIHSCEREGSLDSKIKQEKCNKIDELALQYSELTTVLCNGRKSYDLYQKHFKDLPLTCICLPSTSNANRSIQEAVLFQLWFAELDRLKLKDV